MPTQIYDDSKGRYEVITEHSTYLLDLDDRTLQRQAHSEEANILRKDTEKISLQKLISAKVGDNMLVLLDIRLDGVLTYRMSTKVQSIRNLGPNKPLIKLRSI